jgi:hypothetical protein
MALKLNLEMTPIGVPLPEAYARIVDVGGNLRELLVMVDVYATEGARQSLAKTIERRRHSVDPAELVGPLGPALYAFLKTLPEYAGAEDC